MCNHCPEYLMSESDDNEDMVIYHETEAAGVIILNRRQSLNALNQELLKNLERVLDNVDLERIRCLILTGAGCRAFAAGADVAEMKDLSSREARAFGRLGKRVFRKIETFPIPVIAAINGHVLGGGCELALCCDIRICSFNAIFGLPEVGLGVIPGFGGTKRLSYIVGVGKAKEMIYTGSRITAEEAFHCGLVNHITTPEKLMAEALEMAGKIAKRAPIAVWEAKKVMNRAVELPLESAVLLEEEAFGRCFETEDQKSAMKAFVEKNKQVIFHNR